MTNNTDKPVTAKRSSYVPYYLLALLILGYAIIAYAPASPPPSPTPTPTPTTPESATPTTSAHIGDAVQLRSQPDGQKPVFIFKSRAGMIRAGELYRANADTLIWDQIACVVPSWTRVLITDVITSARDKGGDTSDVLVLEGPLTGCKGVVSDRNLP